MSAPASPVRLALDQRRIRSARVGLRRNQNLWKLPVHKLVEYLVVGSMALLWLLPLATANLAEGVPLQSAGSNYAFKLRATKLAPAEEGRRVSAD